MDAVEYSEKSFIVFGDETKTYKEHLKSMGGRFNARLKERENFEGGPGWIFSMNKKEIVEDFLNNIEDYKLNNDLPLQDELTDLPLMKLPLNNTKYQTVKYKVFKPEKDMGVTIKTNSKTIEGKVLSVETHKDIIDTVIIEIEGGNTKAVIINGKWQIHGYTMNIRFDLNNFI